MFQTLSKIFFLLPSNQKRNGFFVMCFVTLMALVESCGILSVFPFLSLLENPEVINENKYLYYIYKNSVELGITNRTNFIYIVGLFSFSIILISSLYKSFTHYKLHAYIEGLRHHLSTHLLENYLAQEYDFFLQRNSDTLAKSILSEVDLLITNIIRPLVNMFAYIIVVIFISALLLMLNPKMAVLTGMILGGSYLFIFLIVKQKLNTLGKSRVTGNQKRFRSAVDALTGIKIIKLLGSELHYLHEFKRPSKIYASTQALYQTLQMIPKYLIEGIAFGGLLALILYNYDLSNSAVIPNLNMLPIAFVFAFACYRLQPSFQFIFSGFTSLKFGREAVNNIYYDLKNCKSFEKEHRISSKMLLSKELILSNISYSYPNTDKNVLHNINLKIKAGQVIGIVGYTGSGKTTLIDILLCLLKPDTGCVFVDDIKIDKSNTTDFQSNIGYVPQDTFLIDSSIKNNIALGASTSEIDEDQILKVSKLCQLDEFINNLPSKYNTVVGDRGVRLSGGQRQRIGIARALYKNPNLLIFDEATSSLDTITERKVMDSIHSLSTKTIILIAHRLSTIQNCDMIYYLEDGKILDSGSFEDLKEKIPKFKSMSE